FLVNNELISQNRIAVKSSTPTFEVNGKSYRGDLDIYHEGNGTLVVVNNLKLEDYLVGVVNSEVPSNWPTEAKKAQAVAARTYALYQKKYREDPTQSKLYDVEATMMDQVYHGVAREDKNTELLVYQTKGETLFHNGKLIKAFFHSCSGGQTTTGEQVWQKKYGMEGINDPYSENCPNNDWTYLITPNQLIQVLKKDGLTISSIKEIKVLNNQNVNRVDDIKIISGKDSISLSANKLRMLVGPKKIRSTNFIITTEGNSFKFTGKGFGHGVGLSQWGAKNMADKGFGYKDILEFYYPKAKLGRAY
ncbi:SpoIID/LytB domain-containing protein, partial [bacterium]|nr:SpoIID/LytB domain-containing protein [bacterium]